MWRGEERADAFQRVLAGGASDLVHAQHRVGIVADARNLQRGGRGDKKRGALRDGLIISSSLSKPGYASVA